MQTATAETAEEVFLGPRNFKPIAWTYQGGVGSLGLPTVETDMLIRRLCLRYGHHSTSSYLFSQHGWGLDEGVWHLWGAFLHLKTEEASQDI